jgi:hypothetical protein
MLPGDIALAIKTHFIENPELVCSEMLKNLNCCDYIIHVSGSIIKKPPALGTLIGSETRTYNGTPPNINEIAKVEIDNSNSDKGIAKNKDLRIYNTALSSTEAITLTTI